MSSVLRPTGRPANTRAPSRRLLAGRLAFLIPGGIALLGGLDAALLLLGLPAPITAERLPLVHAPLMVFGFIGTVVVLERAVAARRWWGFASPALLGAGGLALLSPLPFIVGQIFFVLGLTVLLAIYLGIWRKQSSAAIAIQALGAFAGLNATVLWLSGVGIPHLAPAMTAFLVLTIAGERLELARISPTVDERAERSAVLCALALFVGAAAALLWPAVGYPLFGISMFALVAWLFRHDVATRLVRSTGLPRFMAVCLLSGYAWLLVAGGIWLIAGPVTAGSAYDAVLHSVFLGFVMSMIMAHAPVILPAVLRRPLPYRPFLYLPVILLHASLGLRVLVGDGRGIDSMVQLGGALNVVAVVLFVVLAVASAVLGPVRPSEKAAPGNEGNPSNGKTARLSKKAAS